MLSSASSSTPLLTASSFGGELTGATLVSVSPAISAQSLHLHPALRMHLIADPLAPAVLRLSPAISAQSTHVHPARLKHTATATGAVADADAVAFAGGEAVTCCAEEDSETGSACSSGT